MKHILLFLTFGIFSIAALAQSDGLCPQSNVPELQLNTCSATSYNLPTSFIIEPVANVTQGTTCVTASNVFRDGWFSFTATSSQTTIIGTVTGGRNLALVVYSGSCGATTMIEEGCINAGGNNITETLPLTTVVGTTYYIRLVKTGNATGSMAGTISVYSPPPNDDCSDAITLNPASPAFPPVCGTQTCGHVYYSNPSSPSSPCGGSNDGDVWYEFTATQAQHIINVASSASFNAVVEVLSGSCGSLVSRGCANATGVGATELLTYSSFTAGTKYYIRVYDSGAVPPATFQFSICISSPVPPTCPASMGAGVVNVSSLPYSASASTAGDDFTSSNTITCGNSNYLQGLDNVFIFTPSASGNISVTLTSGGSNVGIMLYDGCPFNGSGSSCVTFSQSSSGNQFFCTNVSSGTTYYLIVDRNSAGGTLPGFNINITAPSSGNSGTTCASAVNISSLPYSISNQSTLCKINDYDNSSTGSCGSVYESGEDMVFSYTVGSAQCIQVALSNTSSSQAGFTVYRNCPGTGSASCVGSFGGGNVSGNVSLPSAGTYYIIVDSWSPPDFITFNLAVTAASGNSPNDFPCNATPLPLNSTVNGDNRCSSGMNEPGAPSCWTSGTLNTVWYTVVPTGTGLNIRTILGTLTNTQIALYQGSCGSLTQVSPTSTSCNTDETSCGVGVLMNSQMIVTGLTAGQTYYIRVDGENDLTGTFQITAANGSSSLPLIPGQDCGLPFNTCQSNIVNDPGYNGIGNYCDFGPGSNCLANGEDNSVWYTIPIASNGILTFSIIPNDWSGPPSTSSTDYDFAIWETGQSGLSCSQLFNATPVKCNFDPLGVTGTATGGNAPVGYPNAFNASYETPINVTAGQVYRIVISNNSGSNNGFTFAITSNPDPVSYPAPPATMTWNGSENIQWNIAANWGQCTLPNCAVNVVCPSGPANQPNISTSQSVNNVTINAGATLTIAPNVVLSVCGNFINNGNLVTGGGSIVRFVGSANQFISGNLISGNAFSNITMAKPAGTLTLQANIEVKESDSLLTGLLNTNARTISLRKHFYNANGTTTHTSPATNSTYEFIGNSVQIFTNVGTEINLHHVKMVQSVSSTVTLATNPFNNLNVNGILTLTNGKIVTNANEVVVKNPASAAIVNYTVNSYVEGNLRRYLNANATGIFDFPVGHSAKGYQMARINFTGATQIPQLLAYFTPWGAVPNGPVSSECTFANYSLSPVLNHGFWTIDASANPNTGIYNMTLNNTNYTNPLSGWTVMKRTPSGTGPWVLNGTCVLTSTAIATVRNGMQGFSDFAVAQSASPLPIELLSFDANAQGTHVMTMWETSSETNNDYFIIERSTDYKYFERAGVVDGSGTTTEHHSYIFIDESPGTGVIYYRLKQVDFDGAFSYSDVIAVKLNMGAGVINVYPNPAQSLINFEFESTFNSSIKLQVVDLLGKIVIDHDKRVDKGIINSSIDISNIPAGVYFLKIVENDAAYKGVFVKSEN